jgi:Na+/melibiose symporter-like transporter
MSKLEYTLNSAAWTLAGVVITLTYQRLANWYRKRNDKGELPPISSGTYFGTLLVMISIIATLFSYSGKVVADSIKKCQEKVNQNNVAVLNQLLDELNGKEGFISNIDTLKARELLVLRRKISVNQLIIDFNNFFSKQNKKLADVADHRILPTSTCNNGKQLPSDLATPTPTSSR